MAKLLFLFVLVLLTGCAITEEERSARIAKWNEIERLYIELERECEFVGGYLHTPRYRVPNGIPTVWEKEDARCYYDQASWGIYK